MTSKTEDIIIDNATSRPDEDEDDGEEEQIEESVLDGYMADDDQVRAP